MTRPAFPPPHAIFIQNHMVERWPALQFLQPSQASHFENGQESDPSSFFFSNRPQLCRHSIVVALNLHGRAVRNWDCSEKYELAELLHFHTNVCS